MRSRAGARVAALAVLLCAPGLTSQGRAGAPERARGGIIRGSTAARRIALEFTGHEFAEGGTAILDELARRGARASFFLTGDFLRTPAFAPLIRRIIEDGHYLGPHSDTHLLYCDWDARDRTLVTREAFVRDLERNLQAIEAFGVRRGDVRYWVPAVRAVQRRDCGMERRPRADAGQLHARHEVERGLHGRSRSELRALAAHLRQHPRARARGSGRPERLPPAPARRRGAGAGRQDAPPARRACSTTCQRGATGSCASTNSCDERRTVNGHIAKLTLAAAVIDRRPSFTPPRQVPFFPVAVWYSGGTARAPMLSPIGPGSEAAWRADLAAIKSLGFNTVRTWVEWSAAESREGEYRFDQLDLLLRLAEEAGLKVIVQVYVDSAPEWVARRFPDGQFVSQGGIAIRPQAAPGLCFDHPGVRRAVLRFFEEVARRASGSPAFHAYDLWSEPAVMNWALPAYLPNAQFCYCPHSMARFRDWLRGEARQPGSPEPGLVSDLLELGRGGTAPVRHDPDLCRLHGLAGVHRREDRRRPEGARRRREVASTPRIPRPATRRTRRRCSGRWPTAWTRRTTT